MSEPGTGRSWRTIFETIAGGLGVLAVIGFLTMRDDVSTAYTWASETAPKWHAKAEKRFEYLERPEAMIQLAQASDAVHKVEDAHKIASRNETQIRLIQQDIAHAKEGADRREKLLNKIVDKLDARQ